MSESERTNPYASPREESAPAELGDGETDLTWPVRGVTLVAWTLAPPLVVITFGLVAPQSIWPLLAAAGYPLLLAAATVCYFLTPTDFGLRPWSIAAGIGIVVHPLNRVLIYSGILIAIFPGFWNELWVVCHYTTIAIFHIAMIAQGMMLRLIALRRGQTTLAAASWLVMGAWLVGLGGEVVQTVAMRSIGFTDSEVPESTMLLMNAGVIITILAWGSGGLGLSLLAIRLRGDLVAEPSPAERDSADAGASPH